MPEYSLSGAHRLFILKLAKFLLSGAQVSLIVFSLTAATTLLDARHALISRFRHFLVGWPFARHLWPPFSISVGILNLARARHLPEVRGSGKVELCFTHFFTIVFPLILKRLCEWTSELCFKSIEECFANYRVNCFANFVFLRAARALKMAGLATLYAMYAQWAERSIAGPASLLGS